MRRGTSASRGTPCPSRCCARWRLSRPASRSLRRRLGRDARIGSWTVQIVAVARTRPDNWRVRIPRYGEAVLRSRRRALAALFPSLILIAAGCGPSGPAVSSAVTPAVTADLSTACSPAGGAATAYPGWPPAATSDLVPILVSAELAVGPSRLLLNLVDSANVALASPDRAVELRLYNLATDPAEPATTVPGVYL